MLKQGIQANPNADVLGLDLANLEASSGKLDDALGVLKEVLKKNPKEVGALEGKFKIFVYRKDWAGAAGVAEQIKTLEFRKDKASRENKLINFICVAAGAYSSSRHGTWPT